MNKGGNLNLKYWNKKTWEKINNGWSDIRENWYKKKWKKINLTLNVIRILSNILVSNVKMIV